MIGVVLVIVTLALVGILATRCSLDRWAGVEPGEYTVLRGGVAKGRAVGHDIEALQVDRDGRRVVLTRADGSQLVASFVPRDRSEWPSGCPTNINATRMEVLDIEVDPLTLGAVTFIHPVLVRDCPRDPVRLVLREDGAIGGGGGACPNLDPCIYFTPRSTAAPVPAALPHAPKGYELYSWQAGGAWHFTLITGTNRLKVYKEIISSEDTDGETGWVKISVQGTEDLKALLRRLPEGETVTWIGAGWLEAAGTTSGDIRLPDGETIDEIRGWCQEQGIQLSVDNPLEV
jgi:hypothetical protein